LERKPVGIARPAHAGGILNGAVSASAAPEDAVSRILDAMIERERERVRESAQARGSKAATTAGAGGRPKNDGAERRKSKRWRQPVPVLVYGSDAEKQPFHEKTETIDINDDGCLLTVESSVSQGQHLFLTNLRNRAERVNGKTQVGVHFLRPLRDSALPGPADFWQSV
jgi:hypothetical protein